MDLEGIAPRAPEAPSTAENTLQYHEGQQHRQTGGDVPYSTAETGAQTHAPRQPTTANATAGPSGQTAVAGARFNLRTNLFNARTQLFEVFFHRIALGYARLFPATARRVIEFCFLIKAVCVLMVLIYIHMMFVRSPLTCLDQLRNEDVLDDGSQKWPRHGILRVEVIRNAAPDYTLAQSYAKEFYGIDFADSVSTDKTPPSVEGTDSVEASSEHTEHTASSHSQSSLVELSSRFSLWIHTTWTMWFNHTVSDSSVTQEAEAEEPDAGADTSSDLPSKSDSIPLFTETEVTNAAAAATRALIALRDKLTIRALQLFRDAPSRLDALTSPVFPEENYIVEYALEYGFLWLSPATRKRLNISVKLVVLDPEKDSCFGNCFSRFLLDEFLGYNDLLIGSVKRLAAMETTKGFVRNVISGEHYRFVSTQMSRSSYLAAAFIMFIFTFSVSVLLRYSSHQLVTVIADILQMLETNATLGVPAAPLMTVILALVAMETIMSEFFGDSITAFYVILIVSVADHYEAVFCHTEVSRQYWPRFFYLYHFAFYAYHYRFNGQYSNLALLASWLFIVHSMIYFFHHYELPVLLNNWELRQLLLSVHPNTQIVGDVHIQVHTGPSTASRQSNTEGHDIGDGGTSRLATQPSSSQASAAVGNVPTVTVGDSLVETVFTTSDATTAAGEHASGEAVHHSGKEEVQLESQDFSCAGDPVPSLLTEETTNHTH